MIGGMESPYSVLARVYDLQHNTYTPDIPMYLEFARRFCSAQHAPVLELGAGTGRVLLPLAQAGFAITGVDNTAEMLAIAHQQVRALGLAAAQYRLASTPTRA